MAAKIGYIRNARSTGGGSAPPASTDLLVYAPSNFDELETALHEMQRAGVETLIIDGGDGTIREVLSRSHDIWPANGLTYAIVANGNTNLIARSAGALPQDDPVSAIQRGGLLETRIPMLKIDRKGHPSLRGFIMGAGAYETATRIAQEEIASRHGLQVVLTILKLIFSRGLRNGDVFTVSHDGTAAVTEARMLIGLSSLPGKLIFGLEPFWNTDAGPIRWLDIAANPPALLLSAPFVALGKPRRWMRQRYRSGSSQMVELTLSNDLVIDGERFAPGSDGRVCVTAAETVTFLTP
jgi:hypothetical protein